MIRKVLDSCLKQVSVITETAKAVVTAVAKQRAYLAGLVVVVNLQLAWLACSSVKGEFVGPADGASAALADEQCVVIFETDAIGCESPALAYPCFANPSGPFGSGVGLACFAKGTPVSVASSVNVPGKVVDWQHKSASPTLFFSGISARNAIANSPLFVERELFDGFALVTAEALLRRMALHQTLVSSGARARPNDSGARPFCSPGIVGN